MMTQHEARQLEEDAKGAKMRNDDNSYCPVCGQSHGRTYDEPIICEQCSGYKAAWEAAEATAEAVYRELEEEVARLKSENLKSENLIKRWLYAYKLTTMDRARLISDSLNFLDSSPVDNGGLQEEDYQNAFCDSSEVGMECDMIEELALDIATTPELTNEVQDDVE